MRDKEKKEVNKIAYYEAKEVVEKALIKNKQNEMMSFLENLNKTPVSTLPFWKKN